MSVRSDFVRVFEKCRKKKFVEKKCRRRGKVS